MFGALNRFISRLDSDFPSQNSNKASGENSYGFQVLRNKNESIPLEPWFDFIIGINGHLAFNEPPEHNVGISIETFANLPTRILELSRETRTINSVTVGGEVNLIPKRAITIGMKEILAARRLRFYCNRHWQSAVIRRALHGPLTAACPASYLRTHPDASVTIAEYVAAPPSIQLR